MKKIRPMQLSVHLITYAAFFVSLYYIFKPVILSGNHSDFPKATENVQQRHYENPVTHKKIRWGKGSKKHSISILEIDLNHPDASVAVLKAENNISGMERIRKMINKFEKTTGDSIYGAINANYWRAYSYYPIGPTVHDGEMVYMSTIKTWSSAFFDRDSRMYIDNYQMSGVVKNTKGKAFPIFNVNIRSKKDGIIIYNKYAGKKIPFIADRQVKAKAKKSKISRSAAKDILIKKTNELPRKKAICRYLSSPAVNKNIVCVVEKVRKGSVKVPKNGCIVSYGLDFNPEDMPQKGDTLVIKYSTNVNSDIEFYYAVCGAPRIVRDGIAKAECEHENLDNKRFIEKKQRRTAIGTNKEKDKIYFVTVESGNKSRNTTGASITQMADIMEHIGCHDAMNLDGGSSTAMYAYNENKERIYRMEGTMLSVVLAAVKKSNMNAGK